MRSDRIQLESRKAAHRARMAVRQQGSDQSALSFALSRMGPQPHTDRGKEALDSFYQVLLEGLKAEARKLTNLS